MTVHYVSSLHCFLFRCYLLLTFIFHLNLCLGVHASVFIFIVTILSNTCPHESFCPLARRERQVSVVYFRAGYGPEDYPTEARRCPILLLGNRCSKYWQYWTVGFLVNMLDTLYRVSRAWSMMKLMVLETNATIESRTIFSLGAMASETHVCHSLESQL